MSEPSWNEKEKTFQKQKLQENLDGLIERFMFIENNDLLGTFQSACVLILLNRVFYFY